MVAAEEIRRNADRGFKAVSFSEAPHKLGLPTIHSGYWEPFFAACAETETVISLHIGSAGETVTTSEDAPNGVIGALFAACSFTSSVDWLYSGVANRYPDHQDLHVGGGHRLGGRGHRPARPPERPPGRARVVEPEATSEVFRRNFWFCALDDPSGFATRDVIGVDNILVESDYPHSDSTWPNTQALLKRHLADVPVDEQRKICWENA